MQELPIRIIDRWLELIEKDEKYTLSREGIVYMLETLKEVINESNQK